MADYYIPVIDKIKTRYKMHKNKKRREKMRENAASKVKSAKRSKKIAAHLAKVKRPSAAGRLVFGNKKERKEKQKKAAAGYEKAKRDQQRHKRWDSKSPANNTQSWLFRAQFGEGKQGKKSPQKALTMKTIKNKARSIAIGINEAVARKSKDRKSNKLAANTRKAANKVGGSTAMWQQRARNTRGKNVRIASRGGVRVRSYKRNGKTVRSYDRK